MRSFWYTLAVLRVAFARDQSWTAKTSIHGSGGTIAGRLWMSAVYSSVHQRIYAFGGTEGSDFFTDRQPLDDFYEIDITDVNSASVTWTELSPSNDGKPSARAGVGMATDGDYIWIHGGLELNDYKDDLYQYDISTNAMTLLSPTGTLPPVTAWQHFVYCPCSGTPKLYSYGGAFRDVDDYDYDRADFYVLDIGSLVWTQLSANADPGYRSFGGIVYLESEGVEYLYLVYGFDLWNFVLTDEVWAYDISADTWHQKGLAAHRPDKRYGHGTSVIPYNAEDQIAIFGGQLAFGADPSSHTYGRDLWVYSVLYDAWSEVVPLDSSGNPAPGEAPTARYGMAMPRMEFDGSPEDQIFILCGGDGTSMKEDSGAERMVQRFGVPIPTTSTSVTQTSTSSSVTTVTSTTSTSSTSSTTTSSSSSSSSSSSTSSSSTSSSSSSTSASSSTTASSTTSSTTSTSTTASLTTSTSSTETSSTVTTFTSTTDTTTLTETTVSSTSSTATSYTTSSRSATDTSTSTVTLSSTTSLSSTFSTSSSNTVSTTTLTITTVTDTSTSATGTSSGTSTSNTATSTSNTATSTSDTATSTASSSTSASYTETWTDSVTSTTGSTTTSSQEDDGMYLGILQGGVTDAAFGIRLPLRFILSLCFMLCTLDLLL